MTVKDLRKLAMAKFPPVPGCLLYTGDLKGDMLYETPVVSCCYNHSKYVPHAMPLV